MPWQPLPCDGYTLPKWLEPPQEPGRPLSQAARLPWSSCPGLFLASGTQASDGVSRAPGPSLIQTS